ncbi:cysteine hydrolase family protein [Breoghania sp.]|uniref:cysteine hydrolase family protein n=1 Tax=Breoghania sp. TaxID=2065378 RepID=UPI0026171534|nr:cysteine hydrolase family protein [Breoghania sp.]MDJ0930970.1 cysteine hydrolase family protein [Breoghania sp.]
MSSSFQETPRTLRDLAGVSEWTRTEPEGAAVLIIDAQEEYRSGELALGDVTLALQEISRLRSRAKERRLPVIHIHHIGSRGELFDPETRSGTFCSEAEPLAGETVIDKRLPNAFAGTDLAERISALDTRRLIVAGFMTHMCVSSTVRATLDLGLESAIVANACATRALPSHEGGVISANDLHAASLAALSDRFAHILPDAAAI